MLRINVIADIHMDNYQRFNTPDETGRSSRLLDIERVLLAFRARCEEAGAIAVYAGDLSHGAMDGTVNVLAYNTLNRCLHKNGVAIAGNHDQVDRGGSESILRSLAAPNFMAVEKPTLLSWRDESDPEAMMICLPYNRDPKLIKDAMHTLCASKKIRGVPTIVVAHIGLKEESFRYGGNSECIALKDIPKHVDLALFGHFHEPADLSDRAMVVGAPLMHDFNDKNRARGWVEITVGRGYIKCKRHVYRGAPHFVTVTKPPRDWSAYKGHFLRLIAPDEPTLRAWKANAQAAGAGGIEGYTKAITATWESGLMDMRGLMQMNVGDYMKINPPQGVGEDVVIKTASKHGLL